MSAERPRVLVLGAGLAGLTVARQLARSGFEVVLLEKSRLAGGKAGSRTAQPGVDGNPVPGVLYEHGYHIFAPWYRNMLRLTEELGITLRPVSRWHYKRLAAGADDGWKGLYLPSTPHELLDVLRNSPLPAADTLLYFYFVLDMIGMPLSQKAVLDRVTRLGLMRGRWYATESLPVIEEESILKAAAVPVHEMSAYTAKILSSYFLYTVRPSSLLRMLGSAVAPQPSLFMLPGDLQATLIEPFVAAVRKDGVDLRYGHAATKLVLAPDPVTGARRRIAGVEVEVDATAGGGAVRRELMTADAFVVATPLDVSQQLLAVSELLAHAPALGRINSLRTAPMAALYLTLRDGVRPELPEEHCFLMGGEYGLSFIDLRSHWQNPPYALSFISSNFAPLRHLSREEQYACLIGEIERFLGIGRADVAHWCLFPNADPGQQLFINTVGSWTDRPDVACENVDNLYFAGDWVKNRIDLACMEGAVSAALQAAHVIGTRHAHRPGVRVPEPPLVAGRYPPALVRLVVRLLSPLALATLLWARVRGSDS